MPLEVANFISQLDSSNPAATDLMADTDNHLRLIKQVLKNTFPNLNGAVSLSPFAFAGVVPIGGVILWSGAVPNIPAGWVLCAGQVNITRSDGAGTINAPDLRDRFVVGAGSSYGVGQTGGSIYQTGGTDTHTGHTHNGWTDAQGAHDHGGRTANHTLTIAQMPSHSHTYEAGSVQSNFGAGPSNSSSAPFGKTSSSAGGNSPHSHGISTDGAHSHNVGTGTGGAHAHSAAIPDGRPPFYALAYIMKV